MRRISGLVNLVHDTIDAVTTLVQETQEASAARTLRGIKTLTPAGEAAELVDKLRGGISGSVFESIRLVNRTVEQVETQALRLAELAAQRLAPEAGSEARPVAGLEAVEAGLNAAFGDFLATRGNPLAIELGFYVDGVRLALEREALASRLANAGGKVAIFVHGLGCTESAFRFRAREQYGDDRTCYATQLQAALGFTPIFVRYNTGLHISHNGRALASALRALCDNYPVPIEQLVLVGHSMGGLVCRSAAHYAGLEESPLLSSLSHIVCIGSPHHGALLEKATNVLAGVLGFFPTAGTEVPAKLLNARSAGVKDLRYGYLLDEDWTERDPDQLLTDERHDVPLLPDVTYAFIAGSVARDAQGTFGQLFGDLLVRVPSGSGQHREHVRHIPFHAGEVLYGVSHLALLNHPAVYAVLGRLLGQVEPAALDAALDGLQRETSEHCG